MQGLSALLHTPALQSAVRRNALLDNHRHRIAWFAANDIEDFRFYQQLVPAIAERHKRAAKRRAVHSATHL